ncbi:conjugative transposon protein TraM [Mucilaginibacter conchicola]|uniref:Conjugative transposon protein TraM n=1 Tax=Mucilaginibacter conchicola TaxID=2303333 RepID=A0A372NUX2_9SPHI|nr:conjugative transposon protein TraM [Mucilaginibacter conchicola]RFZ92834.1 conjugative transposon protein TraM [Mucilaginibacter conchicola]
METLTLQQKRKRKALLVLPLIVFAFSTLLFKAFGGGQAYADPSQTRSQGFNTHLPDARLKDEHGLDKMGFYDRAAADSAKRKQAEQLDPYAKRLSDSASVTADTVFSPHQPGIFGDDGKHEGSGATAKEVMLQKKLTELQAVINKPEVSAGDNSALNRSAYAQRKVYSEPPLTIPPPAEDPELKQMNGLLEKLLDIQHPERMLEKSNHTASPKAATKFQAIPAVIDGNQKIVQGTVIRMRLLDSIRLNGQLFQKGQLIYGSGDLYNQRVKINIKLIHLGLNIIPVDLTVYDRTDGMEGICVPEAVTGDELKDGMVNGVQTMDMMTMDPSMSAQLATAGINTAKGLFSKKVKRVKGKLKNGHELLLRDNLLIKSNQQ